MANRMLRDWTGSEAIDLLSEGAEVFFTRLIMKADDFGCYFGNPKLLNSTLYPLKKLAIDRIKKYRDECVKAGVIQVYKVDGKEFIHIPNFGQRLRSMNRKFPEPPKTTVRSDDSKPPTFDSDPPPEGKGREAEEEVEEEVKVNADKPPTFEGDLEKAWNEWEQHRKEKRAPLTPSTRKKQIKFLGGRPPNEAIAIIEQSIHQGYTGLFEIKNQPNGTRNTDKKSVRRADATVEQADFGKL